MKKTLIALAILGTAGVAHAQSNVTVYGVMDTGYIYQSGNSWRMGQNEDSKIGFRGVEDLGNGLKATFELERRFDLNDGSLNNTDVPTYRGKNINTGKDWDGTANIGLMGNWGRVRVGYVDELSSEAIRKFDPFNQYGVGAMIFSSQRATALDNTLRYDSPTWAGFKFGASYSLGKNTKQGGELYTRTQKADYGREIDNDGYALSLSYDNYGFLATANWARLADSNDSSLWNLGVGYKFGPAKVTLAFERTKDEGYRMGDYSANWNKTVTDEKLGFSITQKNWLLGLEWDVGPGQFDASIQYGQLDDAKDTDGYRLPLKPLSDPDGKTFKDADIMKYAVGYTYNLSKRTSVYGQVSYTDYDNEMAGFYYTGTKRDDAWGCQVGMTHRF